MYLLMDESLTPVTNFYDSRRSWIKYYVHINLLHYGASQIETNWNWIGWPPSTDSRTATFVNYDIDPIYSNWHSSSMHIPRVSTRLRAHRLTWPEWVSRPTHEIPIFTAYLLLITISKLSFSAWAETLRGGDPRMTTTMTVGVIFFNLAKSEPQSKLPPSPSPSTHTRHAFSRLCYHPDQGTVINIL